MTTPSSRFTRERETLLARIRAVRERRGRLEAQRLAEEAQRLGQQQIARDIARQKTAPPAPKPVQRDELGFFESLGRLRPTSTVSRIYEEATKGNILGALAAPITTPGSGLMGLMGALGRNIFAPAGSATLAATPMRQEGGIRGAVGQVSPISTALDLLSRPGEAERRERGRQALGGLFTSPIETARELRRQQEERPMPLQIASELISPPGIAEAAFPFTKARTAIQAGRRGIRPAEAVVGEVPTAAEEVVSRGAIRLPDINAATAQLINPAVADKIRSKSPLKWAADKLSYTWAADRNSPVDKVRALTPYGEEVGKDAGDFMANRVLASGNPRRLFDLDDESFSLLIKDKKGNPVNFHEIAQFPEKYSLNVDQTRFLDTFRGAWEDLLVYGREMGVTPDDIDKVSGRYFPNIWRYFKDLELTVSSGRKFGTVPFFEKTRFHEFAQDAMKEGYRPGRDPMDDVRILFTAQYQRIWDKQLADIVKPHGNLIIDRIGRGFIRAAATAEATRIGTRDAVEFARMISKMVTRPTKLKELNLKGTANAYRYAGDLMEELDGVIGGRIRISPSLDVRPSIRQTQAQRKASLSALQKKFNKRLKEAEANKVSAKAALQKARGQAQKRPFEFEFPGTPLAGRIFTPTEYIDDVFLGKDLRSLPLEELKKLEKVLKEEKLPLQMPRKMSAALVTMRAGFDAGVMMIHGLPTLFTRPGDWMRATDLSFRALADRTAFARFADDHRDTIEELIQFNQLHGGGSDLIEGLQQSGLVRGFAGKVGGLAGGGGRRRAEEGIDAVQRQFNSWVLAAKVYQWEAVKPMAQRAVAAGRANAMDEAASHVSKLTGTISMANLGLTPTVRQGLGAFVMFAPRYRLASYGLIKDVGAGGLRGSLAREAVGKMMASGVLYYMAIGHVLKQKPNLDPSSSKFLTYKIGNANIGFGSAFVSLSRFGANLVSGDTSVGTDLQRFIRGQISPLTGIGWDTVTGSNYIGEPTTDSIGDFTSNVIAENILPFWMEGFADFPRAGWGSAPAEFLGARTFPVSLRDRAVQLGDIYAQKAYGSNYNDLRKLEQLQLQRDNDDLRAAFDESNAFWQEHRVVDEITKYRIEVDESKEWYAGELEVLMAQLVKQRISAKNFRDNLRQLGASYGALMEENRRKNPEAIEALEVRGNNPNAHVEDIAFSEYLDSVVFGGFEDDEGIFDFGARKAADEAFRAKYGNNVYAYIQERRGLSKALPPLVQELHDARDKFQGYWEVTELLLDKMNRTDFLPTWRAYLDARGFERKGMEEANPFLRQLLRAQKAAKLLMRERNAELDEHLFRWEYVDPRDGLLHEDNADVDLEELVRFK